MNSQFIKNEPSNFSGMARDKASKFFHMIFDARASNEILFDFVGAAKKLTLFIFGVKL
jgi:hypothetical protein